MLVGEFTASIGSGTLTPDEGRQLQECIQTLSGGDDVTQWQVAVQAIHSANQHLDRGRMKLGLKQLRDQVTQHPENPAYRIRLAEAYAETGFNAMARSMAIDAIRMFPESFSAYAPASLIFDMLPVEGEITTAEDRQKAIEFSREAVRRASEDADLKIQLAELLKVSPEGILSSREQLRECVTLHRAAKDTLLPAVISQGTFSATGESTSGYKVTAFIGFMTDVTFLLNMVDDRLKVLTTTGAPHLPGDDALEFLKKGNLQQARQCVTRASEETDAAAESKSLEGSPLARVWTKQDSRYANASRIRYGAMMVASPEKCPDALWVLLDTRRRVRQPEQMQIDRRIVTRVGSQKRWKDGPTAIDRLLRVPGGRKKYRTKKVKFLSSDKQYTQALSWIEPQLRQNTADTHALCLKAQVFEQHGNHPESLRLLRDACSSQEAESDTFNQAAWTAVLAGSIDQQAVVDAERAVEIEWRVRHGCSA